MSKSFFELVIGNTEEKRAWRQLMKRVKALPKNYRLAYKKILNYGYMNGFNFVTESDLLDMFEENAASGQSVQSVVGSDVATFCDELINTCRTKRSDLHEKLNKDIHDYFHKEASIND